MDGYARPPDPEDKIIKTFSDMAAAIEELDETNLTPEQQDQIRRLEADGVQLLHLITTESETV